MSGRRVVLLGRFVRRTTHGVSFLAPARLAPGTIDFIHPGSVNVAASFPFRATPPGIDASNTHVIVRPDHVEVLATGPTGTPVEISWEETCGSHRSASGGAGGQGQERARLPAVLAVKLPRWSSGEDSCYVASTLFTNHFERGLALDLVNY